MSLPCWYYEKKELKHTPSVQEGIDYETECRYRQEGAKFIISTGTKMELGYNTMATGVVYFHRFYMFHSFREFPRYVTACCCLFLAGKVEETPKKCKDIIKIARQQLSDLKFSTFGDNPREEVMTLERILLQTIKFDLQVEHPYQYLLKYAKCLKGDKAKLQKMVQMAWTFVNDSLCTTLSLQWEPEVIAVALMYLAGKLSKFEVVDWMGRTSKHLFWWDMFVEDVTMNLLEDICHQVLDLYSAPQKNNAPDSPPLARKFVKKDGTTPVIVPPANILKPLPAPSHLKPSPLKPLIPEPALSEPPPPPIPPAFLPVPPPNLMGTVAPPPGLLSTSAPPPLMGTGGPPPPPPFLAGSIVPPPPFPPPFAQFIPPGNNYSRPPGYYPPN